jgi:hypothetical protein
MHRKHSHRRLARVRCRDTYRTPRCLYRVPACQAFRGSSSRSTLRRRPRYWPERTKCPPDLRRSHAYREGVSLVLAPPFDQSGTDAAGRATEPSALPARAVGHHPCAHATFTAPGDGDMISSVCLRRRRRRLFCKVEFQRRDLDVFTLLRKPYLKRKCISMSCFTLLMCSKYCKNVPL